jgi:hypothetical protein
MIMVNNLNSANLVEKRPQESEVLRPTWDSFGLEAAINGGSKVHGLGIAHSFQSVLNSFSAV